MQVSFFATLRQIVGAKTVIFDLPDEATVGQLIDLMVTRYPDLRRELLDESGNLYGHVHVFVNGRDVPYLENRLESVLQADDVISVFPAVGGG
ncbi:MAG TPA: ubiquitin-like small modifier protein 1 [Anaerolineales bacterium]|nr:ubiquitin-like small modifier protein 1 [Anaerolineales bacterium]